MRIVPNSGGVPGGGIPFSSAAPFPTNPAVAVFGSQGREGMSLCDSQAAKKEVKDFNKRKDFDLKNDDFFNVLNENFREIPN